MIEWLRVDSTDYRNPNRPPEKPVTIARPSDFTMSPELDSAAQPPRKRGRKRIEEPPVGMSGEWSHSVLAASVGFPLIAQISVSSHLQRRSTSTPKRSANCRTGRRSGLSGNGRRSTSRILRNASGSKRSSLQSACRSFEGTPFSGADPRGRFYSALMYGMHSLAAEAEALRRGERPPPTQIPSVISEHDAGQAQQANKSSSIASTSSPPEVKPRVEAPIAEAPFAKAQKVVAPPAVPAFSTSYAPAIPVRAPPPPAQMPRTPSSLDILATASQSPASMKLAQEAPPAHVFSFDEAKFDFDAPFDFSETMPLPPLFSSLTQEFELLGSGLDGGPGAGTPSILPGADGTGPDTYDDLDDSCPNDEDEPPLLPGNRIPCDKPECDFTAVSCALPMPWRPPTVAGDDKNLWVAQKCWAKLCSHPLFPLCDSVRHRSFSPSPDFRILILTCLLAG